MHNHQHIPDQFNINGIVEYREPITVENEMELTGNHIGSICVHQDATLTINRDTEHIGSITFHAGSTGRIMGTHTGTITVKPGAFVEIRRGQQNGSVFVEGDGVFYATPTAVVNGILHRQ